MLDSLPKPEVILTHESDLDGLVAGVLLQRLARRLFGLEVRLEACNYNYWKQRDLRERAAWVADLNFEARLDRPNWLIIDHHVTDVPAKAAALIHDVNKSAGLLCYELCQQHGLGSPELDRLVHLNNVADLFVEDGDIQQFRQADHLALAAGGGLGLAGLPGGEFPDFRRLPDRHGSGDEQGIMDEPQTPRARHGGGARDGVPVHDVSLRRGHHLD